MPPKAGEAARGDAAGCSQLSAQLSKPLVLKDAAASKVVFARVKGFPHWPAQVLSKAAAKQHLGNVTHKSKSDVPVIFFGTSEIAWVGLKDVTSWEDGMRNSYHNKGRKNKKFIVALEQVRDFLSWTHERIAPFGWWCAPPTRNAAPLPDEPLSSDEEADPMQQDEEEALQLQELQRNLSQRYAAAAAAAQAGAEMPHQQQAAAAAMLQTSAVAMGVYGSRRSANDEPGENGVRGGRRGQLWRHSDSNRSRLGSDYGCDRPQHGRRRTSNNVGHGYAAGAGNSWQADEHNQHIVSVAAAAAEEHMDVPYGRVGHYSGTNGFMQKRRRQLLQQEAAPDGSDSELTDTESLALAAMAIAELAQSSSWDQTCHQQLPQQQDSCHHVADHQHTDYAMPKQQHRLPPLAAAAQAALAAEAMECQQEQHMPDAQPAVTEQQQHPAESMLLTVKLEVVADTVNLGVHMRQQDACLGQLSCAATGEAGLPPTSVGPHHWQQPHYLQQSCAHYGAAAVPAVGYGTALPPLQSSLPCQHEALMQPALGKYEHGGEGLPCACSWKYTVSMPGCGSGAGAAIAVQQSSEVPAVSVCAQESAYYKQLFSGFAAPEHDVDHDLEQPQHDGSSYGSVDHCHVAMHVSAEARGATAEAVDVAVPHAAALAVGGDVVPEVAMPAALPLGARKARTGSVANQIAAANAAIIAAFAAAAPPAAHATTTGTLSAASGGSGSSRNMSWQRKRCGNSSSSSTAVTAAAAAAAAAAHVLTPANPELDQLVAKLLLETEPLIPNPSQGAPDPGFQIPKKMLLNRPPKFEWLKRNQFVSRERPKRMPKDDVSICSCRVEKVLMADGTEQLIGCKEGCLNRLSYIHCDPRTCPCGPYCSNRPFHLLKGPQLDVFLTENRGHGVRVGAPVKAGQFVIEYAGEVIDQAELQRRMDAARDSGEQHFYIMEMGPGLFIDARKKGNHARLLNSCCDPNCETQKWRDAGTGEIRIGIFTTRDVDADEELTYDYMFEHYGVGGMAQGFKCQCGAKNCRGTMDINPERKKDWGRRVEVFWEGDSVYYRGTVTGYSTSSGKHTILYDDGDTERVRLDAVPHRWLDGDASPRSSAQVPSGSPGAFAGGTVPRMSPLPVQQPTPAPADSGSWSQTEQETAVEDAIASPRTGRPSSGKAAKPLGLSPLGRAVVAAAVAEQQNAAMELSEAAADASAAAMMTAEPVVGARSAGYKRSAAIEDDYCDDEAAADALVVLGMAAEAELAEHVQQQQVQPVDDLFQRPQVKRRRLGAVDYLDQQQLERQGVHVPQQQQSARGMGVWPHSSSTSSQSACGHLGLGGAAGAVDGASPLSPAGHGHASGTLQPLSGAQHGVAGRGADAMQGAMESGAVGCPDQAAEDAMDVDGSGSGGDEYLPLEQLLSGIQAIKTQGPAIFKGAGTMYDGEVPGAGGAGQHQQPLGQSDRSKDAVLDTLQPLKRGRLGQLLSLIGHITPVLQHKQQQDVTGVPGVIGRSGSWASSSTGSNGLSTCQLPLFCGGHQQLPQPLPAAPSGGLQPAGSTSSSRTQYTQQQVYMQHVHQHHQHTQHLHHLHHHQQQPQAPPVQQQLPCAMVHPQQLVSSGAPWQARPWVHQQQLPPQQQQQQQQLQPPPVRGTVVVPAAGSGTAGSGGSLGSWCCQPQLPPTSGQQQPVMAVGMAARPGFSPLQQQQQHVHVVPQHLQQPALGVPLSMPVGTTTIAAVHQQQQQHLSQLNLQQQQQLPSNNSRGPSSLTGSFSGSSATVVGTPVGQQCDVLSPRTAVLHSMQVANSMQHRQQVQLAQVALHQQQQRGPAASGSVAAPAMSNAVQTAGRHPVPVSNVDGVPATVISAAQGLPLHQCQASAFRGSGSSGAVHQCAGLHVPVASGGRAGSPVSARSSAIATVNGNGSAVGNMMHIPQAVDVVAR